LAYFTSFILEDIGSNDDLNNYLHLLNLCIPIARSVKTSTLPLNKVIFNSKNI